MSIKTEIDRIITAVTKAHQAVEDMGGNTAAPYLVEKLEAAVRSIPKGEDLSAELEAQDVLISQLEEAVASKASGGGGGTAEPPNIQPLTVTANGTYTASGDVDGYSPIVVNVPQSEMPPTVEQATPSIEVSSSGEITATATQTAGYVVAGTKTATKQLTTKGATTVTPGSDEQTVVQAGTYVTGDIKVSAIPSSGGGSGDLELCTLEIRNGTDPGIMTVAFTTVENGVMTPKNVKTEEGTTTVECLKNSLVAVLLYKSKVVYTGTNVEHVCGHTWIDVALLQLNGDGYIEWRDDDI